MTPAEHYAEAERLVHLATEHWLNPEGGYDGPPETAEESEIRADIQDDARADAALWLAEAQVHATLALYRPDDPTGCRWERPADDGPEPCPDGVELTALSGRRWPQEHAEDIAVIGAVITEEPGPEVIQLADRAGGRWTRDGDVWIQYGPGGQVAGVSGWVALNEMCGPLRIGAVR